MKVSVNRSGQMSRNHRSEGLEAGILHRAQATEVGDKPVAGLWTNTGNSQQIRFAVAYLTPLAMVGDGEAVGLIPNLLHQVQDGRTPVQHDGLVLLPIEINDLLPLGDRGQRLRGNAEQFERFGGSMELTQSAIDQNEARHFSLL